MLFVNLVVKFLFNIRLPPGINRRWFSGFSMAIITLLTDFGTDDAYVGIMKGAILMVNPAATIIDITHAIEPQDLIEAAFLVGDYYKYFPEKTVHIVVIDPGVGSDRAIIALKIREQILLAPDNGVLTQLIDCSDVTGIVRVDNTQYFLKPVSKTFHGRDIFAPVGAHLSKGLQIMDVGAPIDPQIPVRLSLPQPYISKDGNIGGTIISIDRFGNLITNIDWNYFRRHYPAANENKLKFKIGGRCIRGLSPTYKSARHNKPLVIVGSRGYFEFSVNSGNAQQYFGTKKGDRVKIFV